ncbi:tyrosine-type recombinase/integrase [Streptomyces roseofulvus]|uniref:tyrosine-type recombinase/integrase n=1 Tax=Streptomyces roseofulvus TaxID=33902 RepID=UPI0031FBCD81
MTEVTALATAAGALAATEPDAAEEFLASLDRAAAEHVQAERPAKTRASFARDWAVWTEFLDWLARQPASRGVRVPDTSVRSGTLVTFVNYLDQVRHEAPSTMGRRITGVTVEARARGCTVTKTETGPAREIVRRWMRDPVRTARGRGQAPALTLPGLRVMVTAERGAQVPLRAVLRDRAMALVSFYAAMRSAETAALRVTDVAVDRSGNLVVAVPAVKGGEGRVVGIERMKDPAVCPVRAWLAYVQAADITAGPAFRAVTRGGRLKGEAAMSPDSVSRALVRMGEDAGLEHRVTGHSLRSGFVTEGRRAGVPAEKLRDQTGHAASSPVFWVYVRRGELFEESVTGRMEA